MTEHLGCDKHDPTGGGSGDARNAGRSKTVLSDDVGSLQIQMPRERDSSFAAVMVKERQRRLGGVDTIVLSLVAGADHR